MLHARNADVNGKYCTKNVHSLNVVSIANTLTNIYGEMHLVAVFAGPNSSTACSTQWRFRAFENLTNYSRFSNIRPYEMV